MKVDDVKNQIRSYLSQIEKDKGKENKIEKEYLELEQMLNKEDIKENGKKQELNGFVHIVLIIY